MLHVTYLAFRCAWVGHWWWISVWRRSLGSSHGISTSKTTSSMFHAPQLDKGWVFYSLFQCVTLKGWELPDILKPMRPDYHYRFCLGSSWDLYLFFFFCRKNQVLWATSLAEEFCQLHRNSYWYIGHYYLHYWKSPINHVCYRKQECWRIQVTVSLPQLQWHQQLHQVSSFTHL